jgi:nucleotide-binding universal stress UspA family protein
MARRHHARDAGLAQTPQRRPTMTPAIRKILVPTDFSRCADAALDYALTLGERFGATTELLHVWEVPQGIGIEAMPFVAMQGGERLSLMDFVRAEAEKSLDEKVAELKRRGVVVSSRLVPGNAAQAILDASTGFDLIVIGTHGRGAVMHFLLGSVAERVVRKSKIPVLTVRSEGES